MRRSTKLKVPQQKVLELAARYEETHSARLAEGFVLAASSGFWLTKPNRITARFVYRKGKSSDPQGRITHTVIITGITP